VLTHLDLDHAGGLPDFPQARVHLHRAELAAALTPRLRERQRYVSAQWAHGPYWQPHDADGEDWHGFSSVRAVGDDVLLVPLAGHTRGHSGVAVRRPSGGWFLHAGDAYFFHGDKDRPRTCPPGLRTFQALMQVDRAARLANLERLQELHATRDDVAVFSAHDRVEYLALEGVTG
jgi:glyoxylase-like metal-dependent hydrolase (beta-lactamase superfamily II)